MILLILLLSRTNEGCVCKDLHNLWITFWTQVIQWLRPRHPKVLHNAEEC